jgi:hypothetical protein
MSIRHGKEHLRESIALATILGMLLGYWFGVRASGAGFQETASVLAGAYVASIMGGSWIDRRHAVRPE